ncbi:MAG: alpha/beta fold hydrolase [Sphaerochaeta sp.]|jgi:carboxylesterase|nr:alpha/beta fold hydrolase [Sphaerochaeta sp.]MCH3919328.1 alpha/beta fold hydrolase [Sphaerochaeta sp.]MCI2045778.1 alpha/beta fold hydrolase [Sphaerochaeta sp.]MCI2075991.1 alpha/beta fold hydrolase [Sphaerochaeta sp.]MCI2097255.1 alpha/beta fold hydrolase [Sphaerochaeta sp.]
MHISYDVPDWSAGWYQDKAPVRRCARPWKMVHDAPSDVAVLLCHGYTGYPGELIRPGIDLYDAGFDCYAVRYPGHGTSGDDFQRSGREDWLGTAENAYQDLASRYHEVYLVGHSMGGSVAVLLSSRHPEVKKMALIAPALVMKSLATGWRKFQLTFAQVFSPKKIAVPWNRDPGYHFLYEGDPDDDAYLGSQYWSWLFPRKVWDLHRMCVEAVKALDAVKADTLVLTGGKDDAVDRKAGEMVAAKPLGKNRHVHLPNATHLIPYDKDKASQDQGMGEIVTWFTT